MNEWKCIWTGEEDEGDELAVDAWFRLFGVKLEDEVYLSGMSSEQSITRTYKSGRRITVSELGTQIFILEKS